MIFLGFEAYNLKAQQGPTGNVPANNTTAQAAAAWYRGGNNNGNGNNNIFGTRWNSGIYTITDNQNRMKLNGSVNYPVNGFGGQRDGYLLLGYSQNYATSLFTGATSGAYSQLHLNGPNGSFVQNGGYRPWMQTGVTFTDNDDLSYFGLRKVGQGNDKTETILSWSDNSSAPSGPDDLVLRFTAAGGNPAIDAADLVTPFDVDGLHVARFTGEGDFGLGNTFGIDNPIYVEPQSLAHYSLSNLQSVWQQYTNRNIAVGTGTSETANDGLRIGILGNNDANANGTAAIYNQELKPILLSTNANSNAINPVSGATGERVRITSVNTPTNLPTGGMGIYTPGGSSTNFTRMSVSHNPSNPVTRPLSLLHLGYNSTTTTTTTDGWRPWMDVGMFVSNKSDNVYLGLKNETTSILVDRQDAVLGWGDNPTTAGSNGPDNLRFIFTSASTSVQTPPSNANTVNGLEVARMEPTAASTLSGNYGMMGIGDFSPAGPNTANPVDAKLDIDGDLRIRTVTSDNNLTQVLVVDPNDKNRVHYRDINTIAGSFGNICGNTQNPLNNHHEIPMNNNNVIFTDPNSAASNNRVGIGLSAGNCIPSAKLHVINQNYGTISTPVTGVLIQNSQNTSSSSTGLALVNNSNSDFSWGIVSSAFGGVSGNTAVMGIASNTGLNNTGIIGGATDGFQSNTGMSASAQGPAPFNLGIGAFATKSPNSPQNTGFCVGVNAQASRGKYAIAGNFNASGGLNNYGVYSTAPASTGNYAGYFNGNVLVTGTSTVSDQMFKTNVSEISNALKIIKELQPKTYYFDTIQFSNTMSFSSDLQYGFIAQEVEVTYPEIVGKGVHPAKIDSIGQVISPSFDYKTVNYNAIIPINTQAIKELNDKVDKATLSDVSIKTNVQDLSGSLQTILDLRGVSFDWNHSVNQEFQFDSSNHIGFIAQEVQSIEPRLTFNGDNNLLHVDYNKVVPVLVEAIQEQNAIISYQDSMINELNNRLSNLENCINSLNLCNQNQPNQMAQPTTGQTITLNTVQSIVLNQNVPNPFAEQTVITFSLPENIQKANILFYDSNGKMINNVDIKERGNSQLNVFANDLSTGIYTYTLVADGQIVATKKMVKQ
jgi:hypothetical protein